MFVVYLTYQNHYTIFYQHYIQLKLWHKQIREGVCHVHQSPNGRWKPHLGHATSALTPQEQYHRCIVIQRPQLF